MRRIIYLAAILIISLPIFSQGQRPFWVDDLPTAPVGSGYVFAWGAGKGANPEDAKKNALNEAIKKGLMSLNSGTYWTEQNLSNLGDNGFEIKTSSGSRSIREFKFETAKTPDNQFLVFVLIQIQENANIKAFFAMLPSDFVEKERMAKDIYFSGKCNNFIALGANVSYPLKYGIGLSGRYGNYMGFGYYASVGISYEKVGIFVDDLGSYSVATKSYIPFHYKIGAKFFPYKGAFISLDYGTITMKEDNAYHYSSVDDYYNDTNNSKWKSNSWLTSGMTLAAGWDYVSNLSAGVGFYLSANVGTSFDFQDNNWLPAASVTFGIAFGL